MSNCEICGKEIVLKTDRCFMRFEGNYKQRREFYVCERCYDTILALITHHKAKEGI